MLIVANWKAYVEDAEKAKELFTLSKKLVKSTEATIVLAVPAPLLGALTAKKSSVLFSAQDVSASVGGAVTGENTARMYESAGATYSIVGHSERRALGDTDQIIAEKVSHALLHGLTPILCVGERERDVEGRYLAVIREEITNALSLLTSKERGKVIIAYEPLWAIGKDASSAIKPDDLTEMVLYIRKILSELLPGKSSSRTIILYGGSVESENAGGLVQGSGIDGLLVGHASTDPEMFSTLVKELA
jgi:triosephosphate isomerase